MRTYKIIVSGITAGAIVIMSISSTSAYGQGGWGGKGMMSQYITAEQKEELQSMTHDERREFIQKLKKEKGIEWGKGEGKKGGHGGMGKGSHDPVETLESIEKQDLDDLEIDLLLKQYEEEMMANELYLSFYEKYDVETFKKIAESEAKHMAAVQALLDRYELDTSEDYDHIKLLYEELKAKGSISLLDALEVGLRIEKIDIADIIKAIKSTDNDDIKTIFVNIGGASYNHMRGFAKAINSNDLTTDIDYSDFLTDKDLDTKGPLKVKLAERLESEGVELPEGVTSEALKEKMKKGHGDDNDWKKGDKSGKGWGKYGDYKNKFGGSDEYRKNMGNNNISNISRYQNNDLLKQRYKNTYTAKYGDIISKMDDKKLEAFIGKIDNLIEKITDGDYSERVKEKYLTILDVLRELAEENLDESDSFLEGLFD